jgi:hypothetical protein
VYDEPEPDTAKEQPVAVPAFAKSPPAPPAKPETAASNVSEYAIDDALLGEETAEVNDDTDGAVVSIVSASAVAEVRVSVTPSRLVVAVARTR